MLRAKLRPRIGLLGKFALASALPLAALGLVLAHSIKEQIESRALDNAREAAVLSSRLGVQPMLTPADLENGLSPAKLESLDRALRTDLIGKEIARVKIWSRDGRVVYSDDRDLVGRRFEIEDELEVALDGEVASEVSELEKQENVEDRRFGRLLEVYVPLRFAESQEPAGAFEMYLPYQPIAATIEDDTTTMYLLILGGLALLYLVLFRIVASASKKLLQQSEENRHQALHDALTGLPNRALFHDRVTQALASARRSGRHLAVALIDLDRFKDVNDTLGHESGDRLLRALGPRLRAVLRETDTVARLGGDEFGVLLPDIDAVDDAIAVAEKLRGALGQPFTVDGMELETEASLGIAVYPEHGDDVATLLRRADVAMYIAKESHGGIESYAPELDHYSPARLGLLSQLRRAIDQHELVVFYQPKASLRSGEVRWVEALVRWEHPERGLLLPDEFVPLAEHTGLMRPLTAYVLEQALRQCRAWDDAGLSLSVAVNLSARDLLNVDLPDDVATLLDRCGVPPMRLELEVTESTVLADPLRARSVLTRLSELGVSIALDDFGSGYTSLGYLKRLPIDVLKIDKSFVLNMGEDTHDAVIVRSAIELGHNLGFEVVAEGVETATTWRELGKLGCDIAQGFYLSTPVRADELVRWLEWVGRRGIGPSAAPDDLGNERRQASGT